MTTTDRWFSLVICLVSSGWSSARRRGADAGAAARRAARRGGRAERHGRTGRARVRPMRTQSQPLRRVSVTIQAGELDVPHIGVTDDNGRVVFRDLAAGNYLLTAERGPGYVPHVLRIVAAGPRARRGGDGARRAARGRHSASACCAAA